MIDWLTSIRHAATESLRTMLFVIAVITAISLFYALTSHVWTTADTLVWGGALYFLPTIVAYGRQSTWRSIALLANLFFGWTVIGWFVAWFFAFHKREAIDDSPHRAPDRDVELWR